MTVIFGYKVLIVPAPPKDVALIINKKKISLEECNRLISSLPTRPGSRDDCINSLITKELMIQESQKEGIDKEEAFRRSIQNFYEQSLIKVLMDRKFASLQITISDDELNKYMEALDKKFHITVFSFDDLDKAKNGKYTNGESRVVHFEDLSNDIRDRVVLLKEGQITEPLKIEGKYVVIRLDKTEKLPSRRHSDAEKKNIRRILKDDKKGKIISEWIADLRNKATITNFLTADK
jgi:parvulin-like peptidyl-prolyl isomerase